MSRLDENSEKHSNLINKLPFVLGALAAVLTGVVSYSRYGGSKDTYIRMAAGLAVFFIVGAYVRASIFKIYDELDKKEEERIRNEREAEEREAEQARQKAEQTGIPYSSRIDVKIEPEEFEPLKVREVLRNNLNSGKK